MSKDETISYCNAELGPLPTTAPKVSDNITDLFSFKGKVVSVTGSSGGIGWAVAEGFAQAGADVAIWYHSHNADEKAKYLAEKYGVKSIAYGCNIGIAEEVQKTVKQIESDFGKIDVFVANAGVAWTEGPEIDVEDLSKWNKIIDTDLNSVFYCAHAIGPIFRKQGKGSLVLTGSMSATIVNIPQLQAAYNVAKAGVKHLAKSLAVEWAPFARVNAVSPGYIATDISDFVDKDMKAKWWQLTPLGREGHPKELVGAYLYLASDAATYTTGCDLAVDGGYTVP
ncbi:Sou2 protein [Candida orthopsilosis Co 90-125]|uniref:Sou2 protein n=1 Tax=Candida orthopsilosis (strain 90-125) TaxID=1136231 RepID=H8WZI4_CANO9|nr:Sou2 protein [Candida orthopsilosis Co 90-125]CCG21852.1 Sou2 protein [Candida orthopsilosis Co 90-125]